MSASGIVPLRSDNVVEKSFLYLLAVSLLIHCGVFAVVLNLPSPKQQPPKDPVFIDLQQMPDLKSQTHLQQQEARRLSKQKTRVKRETAPWGFDARNSGVNPPSQANRIQARESQPQGKLSPLTPSLQRENQVAKGSSVSSLLKRTPSGAHPQGQSQFFPGSSNMARLEEGYRRKFEKDIAEGDTKFLDTDDIQFGSFLHRFENSVYGVWRYPQEAAQKGINGITPVKITFNRHGEIVHIQLLESSGAKVLDDEVFRTLKLIGPVGGFPKGYDKDEFKLIAFFQYGMTNTFLR
ncbi:MAG: TonB family protein [Desulfuromonadales bacterium]|nr:TonB family protein [Desulfuromonadales bacterium]